MNTKSIPKILMLAGIITISGCSVTESYRTNHYDDACKMLNQNKDWFKSSLLSYRRWGVPISTQLAVIKTESSFNNDASAKTSTAYGFAQALNGTFKEYKEETGNANAVRSSYRDSVDFIGWYFSKTTTQINHSSYDAESFYLAYHEGIGGYKNKTYLKKDWLVKKAKQTQRLANKYRIQINKCKLQK